MIAQDFFDKHQLPSDSITNTNHGTPSKQAEIRVTNQLHFRTNSNTILPYLKTKADDRSGHPLFSLNSIVKLPANLTVPLNDDIILLSLWNIDLPILDEKIKSKFLQNWTAAYKGKVAPSTILENICAIRKKVQAKEYPPSHRDVFERTVDNYMTTGFFSQFDWCMEHWGTTEDIADVKESTFLLPTAFIEFQTVGTPPIIALQLLANTFPSVLFTLLYRYPSNNSWNEVQFYPFPPFGY